MITVGKRERSISPSKFECLADPCLFFTTYLKDLIPETFPTQEEWIDDFLAHQYYLLEGPIEHGKTTTFPICMAIYYVCLDRDIRIGLFSNTDVKPKRWLAKIKAHLRFNPDIVRDFGIFYDKRLKWDDQEIVVPRHREMFKGKVEPTVSVYGKGSEMLGTHFDIVFMDDPVALKDTLSQRTMETDLRWHKEELLGTLEPNSKLCVTGHVQASGDLYEWCESSPAFFFRKPYTCYEESGEPIAPNLWNTEDLEKKEELMGAAAFRRKMLNIRPGGETTSFDPTWIDAIEEVEITNEQLDEAKVAVGVDPATGVSRQASEFAMIAGAFFCEPYELVVLDIICGKLPPSQRIEAFKKMQDKWLPLVFRLETNSQQIDFFNALKEEKDIVLPLEPHITGRNKANLVNGVPRIAAFLEKGRIKVKTGCPHFAKLKTQLKRYPNYESDLVMALWFLLMALLKRLPKKVEEEVPYRTNFMKRRNFRSKQVEIYKELLSEAENAEGETDATRGERFRRRVNEAERRLRS